MIFPGSVSYGAVDGIAPLEGIDEDELAARTANAIHRLRHALHMIVVGVLVLANWLANRHNKSLDAREPQVQLVGSNGETRQGLKQDIRLTYFDKTENLQRGKDLLDRYDTLSTKLKVDYIDPDKKPQAAKAAGIRNYGSIVIDAGPRHEEAKSLTEEEVTSALIRATRQRRADRVLGRR
jgi:hypothetical protein